MMNRMVCVGGMIGEVWSSGRVAVQVLFIGLDDTGSVESRRAVARPPLFLLEFHKEYYTQAQLAPRTRQPNHPFPQFFSYMWSSRESDLKEV